MFFCSSLLWQPPHFAITTGSVTGMPASSAALAGARVWPLSGRDTPIIQSSQMELILRNVEIIAPGFPLNPEACHVLHANHRLRVYEQLKSKLTDLVEEGPATCGGMTQ